MRWFAIRRVTTFKNPRAYLSDTVNLVPTLLKRFRNGMIHLPSSWGLGQAQIHSSLIITMLLLAVLLLGVSIVEPGYAELRTVAFTLPVIWILSLAVRIAAQQLAIGEFARDAEMVVGPSGNLQTDYEYLPPRAILAYAASGQLASMGLIALGLIVGAAMSPQGSTNVKVGELFDLQGGWESRAWASQIMWVNIFMFGLHWLPTVPFDMRAAVFAYLGMNSRSAQEPHVFRRMASYDSHVAGFMLGAGLSAAAIWLWLDVEVVGWYAAIAAAVYLYVASRWEVGRAEELEEQYAPQAKRLRSVTGVAPFSPHLEFDAKNRADLDAVDRLAADVENSDEPIKSGDSDVEVDEDDPPAMPWDVDEILRKLHREGAGALTAEEQQALLSASREIQDRRGQAT